MSRKGVRRNRSYRGRLVIAVVGLLVVSGLGYLIYVGTSGGGSSTSQPPPTTQASTHHPAYTARTESAGAYEPTCSGLNGSQLAANQRVIKSGLRAAYYDTQYWLDLQGNQPSLSFSVQAQAKIDSFGYGPGLMVNGVTGQGYWYQVGLTYNWWNYTGLGYAHGFQMFYQVYSTQTGNAVYPYSNGSTSPISFKTLQSGDTVTLSLTIVNDQVMMQAKDLQTGETIAKSYPAFGSTYFSSTNPQSDYTTGVLTEWPHVVPYFCPATLTQFTSNSGTIGSGWVQTNVWNFTGYPRSEWWENGPFPNQFRMHTPPVSFTITSSQQFYVDYLGLGSVVSEDRFTTE